MPGDRLRRCARSISRPNGAIQNRRQLARHQLSIHGRLRRPRLLLSRDGHSASRAQGQIQGPHHNTARQPRVETDYTGVWVLRRVLEEIRQRQRLEVLYGLIRLFAFDGIGRLSSRLTFF
jgi:hypothetical protein